MHHVSRIKLSRDKCDYRRVLDRWSDLFDSLIQRVTALYNSLLHTHTHTHTHSSVHSHVFTIRCSLAASKGRYFPFSGFPKYPRPQHSASNNWQATLHFTPLNFIDLTSLTVLLITSWHGPHTKQHFSLVSNCFRGNTLACKAVT
jgi:hypothetical protein